MMHGRPAKLGCSKGTCGRQRKRPSLIGERSWPRYRPGTIFGCEHCYCYYNFLLSWQSWDGHTQGNADGLCFLPSAVRLSAAFEPRSALVRSSDEHEIRCEQLSEPRLRLQQGLAENGLLLRKNQQL